jgi:hypothetical protein
MELPSSQQIVNRENKHTHITRWSHKLTFIFQNKESAPNKKEAYDHLVVCVYVCLLTFSSMLPESCKSMRLVLQRTSSVLLSTGFNLHNDMHGK